MLGAIGVIIVYFIFVRPLLRSLSFKQGDADASAQAVQTVATPGGPQAAAPGQMMPGYNAAIPNLGNDPAAQLAHFKHKDATYEQKVDMARSLVMDDPARVANVMKQWVSEE